MQKALDYLLQYAAGEQKWPYKQISEMHTSDLAFPLLEAATAFKDPKYEQAGTKLAESNSNVSLVLVEAANSAHGQAKAN